MARKNYDSKFFERFLSDDHVEVGFGDVTNKATVVAGVGRWLNVSYQQTKTSR
ncbi:MAG: hypothetical protein ABJC10_14485 [Acidobacteriota bacterium]